MCCNKILTLLVICATGFDVSHRPRYPMIGENNVNLREKWAEDPESYLSVMTPDFPNYFMVRHPISFLLTNIH